MGCCECVGSQEDNDKLPEEAELANRGQPGTWGKYIPSPSEDDDDSVSDLVGSRLSRLYADASKSNKSRKKSKRTKWRKKQDTKDRETQRKESDPIPSEDIDMETDIDRVEGQPRSICTQPTSPNLENDRKTDPVTQKQSNGNEMNESDTDSDHAEEIEMERLRQQKEKEEEAERERQRKAAEEEECRLQREREEAEKERERERIRKEEEEQRLRKERRANKRKLAVKELLDTERTYVALLKTLIDVFVDPLAERPDLLENKIPNAQRILFSDIKIIYGVNEAFLNDLSKKLQADAARGTDDDDQVDEDEEDTTIYIGEDLRGFVPYFRSYQSYLNNYENASVLLQRVTNLEANKFTAFNEWYQAQREKYCENKSMDFYLILPIQRLPRYKLCLKEIIKHTENDHPDLQDLQKALTAISDLNTACNERMKEYQSRSVVREIENQFVSYSSAKIQLVTPSRRFIRQGTLWRVTRKGDEHELTFYLFNDLLCYASKQMNIASMRLQMRLPIDDVFHVKDVFDAISMKKYGGRAFEIHSSEKSILVFAEDIQSKTEWLLALTQCFKKIQNGIKYNGKCRHELSAAVWVPDNWSDCCMVDDCGKKFNSLTTRRHHCRWCGKLICSTCGKYKLAHKIHSNSYLSPVCKDCYHQNCKRFRANTTASLYKETMDGEDDDAEIEENRNGTVMPIDENIAQ